MDVWDVWIDPCCERCTRDSRSKESSYMSSIAAVIVSSAGGVGGLVMVRSCMSMCWGCVGLAVVVVERWVMEALSVGVGISSFSKVYESVINLSWVWRRLVACWHEICVEGNN